jgi:transposase
VDEPIAVPLPEQCRHCGGVVAFQRTEVQYQEEIVRRTLVRRFDIAIGECRRCGRQMQGRHPLQTSDALGAAAVQLGPEALTLAALMNKQMGLSLGHTTQVLQQGFGLTVSRSGICRALARMANKAAPTYQGLILTARQSLVNVLDETGWRVEARLQWTHVAVSEQVTVYAILPGRGFSQLAWIVGADYQGFLVHDGWAPYYKFASQNAFHQSCLNHLISRCKNMVEILSRSAARFPLAVKGLLQRALAVRDRYAAAEVSWHGLRTATGRLEAELHRLLQKEYRCPANIRLANHLAHEQPWLFSFLHCPGLDATNHLAEQAIRLFVMARKVWGGNRTWNGARTQQILGSVLRTCWQQGKDPFPRIVTLLRSPTPLILDIVPNSQSP